MYKILVKSFIPQATGFPHSPLPREQLTPELELVQQFGSRSEVFSEEGNTTKLQQQSLQGSSSFLLAGTTIPPGLQLISHCIPRGDVGLEGTTPVPAISHCSGGFWVHTNHLRCSWQSLWILQALQTCLMSHVPKSSSPGGSFKPQCHLWMPWVARTLGSQGEISLCRDKETPQSKRNQQENIY